MSAVKILYVDDEPTNLANFKMNVEGAYEVLTASSGQEGLVVVKANPDLAVIVADQRMPRMSGVEFLIEVMRLYPDMVRIMLTAYVDVDDLIDSINRAQVYHYIRKPWLESEMLHVLGRAVDRYLLVHKNRKLVTELDLKNQRLEEDLKKRQALEDALGRREQILAALHSMSSKLLLNRAWLIFVEGLIERLGGIIQVCRIRVFRHQSVPGAEFSAVPECEWWMSEQELRFRPNAGMAFSFSESGLDWWRQAFVQGEHLVITDSAATSEDLVWLKKNRICSMVALPVWSSKQCWGHLSFEHCKGGNDWSVPEIDALKVVAGFIGTAIERQKNDEQLLAYQGQLAHGGRLRAMGEMASGMGHEIHQPLSVINLNAEFCQDYLRRHAPGSPALEAAVEIREYSRKIERIINAVRFFSRASAKGMERVNLWDSIDQSLLFFREQFRAHQIELVEDILHEPPLVEADSQRFEQVIVNLLSNARHAVDQRAETEGDDYKKRVEFTLQVVDLGADHMRRLPQAFAPGRALCCEVSDNGIGMSEEIKSRCLEPFFTTKDVGEGTGLGLSVSRDILRQLNMVFEIESSLGEGSQFRVLIPLTDSTQASG
ncbi:MAG: response regulator [Desulfobulbaceae bacterium]|uniref:histidine kinase n=1 Tax=Candidatus Desulfatifera sulfidica TaxID=2841691 RepID=A0A8J6NBI9_9BACT|nr:response regulator [Candidatus Desulfatifera sulfidica]